MRSDITKNELYESVKTIIENDKKHLHLNQHKLYTLFSIAFQSMLFQSTKNPGAYIIRIETPKLAEKLARKAKDPSTRKFMQSLLVPRKMKFEKSMLYVDFFNINSWNMTAELSKEKIKGAIIVKDSTENGVDPLLENLTEADQETAAMMAALPKDYFLTSIQDFIPNLLLIAYEENFDHMQKVQFPFIVKQEAKTISGVTLGNDVNWDNLD